MKTNLPTQEERHTELARMLGPQTAQEDMLVGWLAGSLSPRGSFETMIRMLERTTSQAYNRGWSAACAAFAEHEQPATSGAVTDSLLDADTDIAQLDADQRAGDERRQQ